MKVKVSFFRTLRIAFIAYLIGAVIVMLAFWGEFFKPTWTAVPVVIIIIYVALCVGLFLAVLLNNFYIIENKQIIVKRFLSKALYYRFSDVIYIEEELSLKKKTLTFVTKRGDVRYLTFDKEGKIYDAMVKGCKNLITEEELYARYPRTNF